MSQDNATAIEGDELISRMNSIRNLGEFHVAELQEEAQRLVDWREHVRAQPLLAVGVATVAGFVLAHYRVASVNQTQGSDSSSGSSAKTTVAASVAMGLTAVLGSVATTAVRAYAIKFLNNLIEGKHNGHRDHAEATFKR